MRDGVPAPPGRLLPRRGAGEAPAVEVGPLHTQRTRAAGCEKRIVSPSNETTSAALAGSSSAIALAPRALCTTESRAAKAQRRPRERRVRPPAGPPSARGRAGRACEAPGAALRAVPGALALERASDLEREEGLPPDASTRRRRSGRGGDATRSWTSRWSAPRASGPTRIEAKGRGASARSRSSGTGLALTPRCVTRSPTRSSVRRRAAKWKNASR